MSNNPPVPTLSTHGWVTNVSEKIDFLLAHFVESDAEQDNNYERGVSNMQVIVQKFNNDPNLMASELESKLRGYLTPYYPEGVTVESMVTDAKDQDPVNEFRKNIGITIKFKVDGVEYYAPHQLRLIDSKFESFTRINN